MDKEKVGWEEVTESTEAQRNNANSDDESNVRLGSS